MPHPSYRTVQVLQPGGSRSLTVQVLDQNKINELVIKSQVFELSRMVYQTLTVSIRSENLTTVRLGFPASSILFKRAEYFLVKITHACTLHFDVLVMNTLRKNLISGIQ